MENTFTQQLQARLDRIDPTILHYLPEVYSLYQEQYDYIYDYAINNELLDTALSLQLFRGYMMSNKEDQYVNDGHAIEIYIKHVLSITRLLIDVRSGLPHNELDIMLSAAICHVLIEKIQLANHGEELIDDYGLDPDVLKVIHINLRNKSIESRQESEYYMGIQQNHLALLIKLADRGNIMSNLHISTLQRARVYVRDTKLNFYPMGIYGKEHYPELARTISLLMDKIKSLTNVMDIVSSRYLEYETAYNEEMLDLLEENARIRAMIIAHFEG